MTKLLSIVVPTKNRYKYLKQLIQLVDSLNLTDFELLIQDNTLDNGEILDFLKTQKRDYLSYYHETKTLSQTENSNLAVFNSVGEYVCFIGDDDGVTKHIVDCVRWMKANHIDALRTTTVSYYWPDFIPNLATGNVQGTLIYEDFQCKVSYLDPNETRREVESIGFCNPGRLPMVYNGIVRRDCLDKIYNIGNTFFPGPSPDIANGVALSFFVKTYAILNFPVIITGASMMNGGGIAKLKKGWSAIEDIPYLPKDAKDKWEKNIPRIWSGESLWPESAIKALRYLKKEDEIKYVNTDYLLANFIFFHKDLASLGFSLSPNKIRMIYYLVCIGLKKYYKGILKMISMRILKRNKSNLYQSGLNNIQECHNFIMDKTGNVFPIKSLDNTL